MADKKQATAARQRTKSLEKEAAAHARAVAQAMVDRDFKKNASHAAAKIGLSQSTLQAFLAGTRGAGVRTLLAIAEHEEMSLDELVGRAPQPRGLQSDDALEIAIAYHSKEIGSAAIEKVRRARVERNLSLSPAQWGKQLQFAEAEEIREGGAPVFTARGETAARAKKASGA